MLHMPQPVPSSLISVQQTPSDLRTNAGQRWQMTLTANGPRCSPSHGPPSPLKQQPRAALLLLVARKAVADTSGGHAAAGTGLATTSTLMVHNGTNSAQAGLGHSSRWGPGTQLSGGQVRVVGGRLALGEGATVRTALDVHRAALAPCVVQQMV